VKPAMPPILIDTREQRPWVFELPSRKATVATGADYTVQGFEAEIGIERKSLQDLVGSLTQERERFGRSLAALRTRPWRCVIVEGNLSSLLAGWYRGKVSPNALLGTVAAIMADGVPICFCDDATHAARLAERLLSKMWTRAAAAREAAAALAQVELPIGAAGLPLGGINHGR